MIFAILFILAPLLIYLALATIPVGRAWGLVAGLVAAFLAYLWLGYLMAWGPFWTGQARADAYILLAAGFYTAVAALGVIMATLGRAVAERLPGLGYGPLALLMFFIVFVPVLALLGL